MSSWQSEQGEDSVPRKQQELLAKGYVQIEGNNPDHLKRGQFLIRTVPKDVFRFESEKVLEICWCG